MKGLVSFIGLVALFCLLFGNNALQNKDKGKNDWHVANIGNIQHMEFPVSQDQKILGVLAASEEGILAFLDKKTGAEIWRKLPPEPRPIQKLLVAGQIGMALRDDSTTVEVFKIHSGKLIESLQLTISDNPEVTTNLKIEDYLFYSHEGVTHVVLMNSRKILHYKIVLEPLTPKMSPLAYNSMTAQGDKFLRLMLTSRKENLLILQKKTGQVIIQPLFDIKNESTELDWREGDEIAILKDRLLLIAPTSIRVHNVVFKEKQKKNAKDTTLSLFDKKIHKIFENSPYIILKDNHSYTVMEFVNNELKLGINVDIIEGRQYSFFLTSDDILLYAIYGEETTHVFDSRESALSNPKPLFFVQTKEFSKYFGKIEKVWGQMLGDLIIFKTGDVSIHAVSDGKRIWKRYEGLSQIEEAIVINTRSFIEQDDYYYNHYQRTKELQIWDIMGMISSFVDRVILHLIKLKNLILNFIHWIASVDLPRFLESYINGEGKAHGLLGLEKTIIIRTKQNKLFGIDAQNGHIQWHRFFPEEYEFKEMYSLEDKEGNNLLCIIESEGKSIIKWINSENGEPLDKEIELESKIIKSMKLGTPVIERDTMLLLDENMEMRVFPSKNEQFIRQIHSQIFLNLISYDQAQNKNKINAYRINKDFSIDQLWNFYFSSQEKIVKVVSVRDNKVEDSIIAQPTEENNGDILYKFLDANMIAIATINEENSMFIYIINGVNGKLFYQTSFLNVDQNSGIQLIFDENILIVNYKNYVLKQGNVKTTWNKISTIELYEKGIESDFTELIKKYYSEEDKVEISSFSSSSPLVLEKTFITPMQTKNMGITRTKGGITNKHILLVLANNKILTMPLTMISARRPTEVKEGAGIEDVESSISIYENKDYPNHEAVLSFNYIHLLNYDLQLAELTHIHVYPTQLESTSVVFAYGVDLFFSKIAPEKTFDKLHEDFSHELMYLALLGLIILTLVMKKFATQKKLREKFLLA